MTTSRESDILHQTMKESNSATVPGVGEMPESVRDKIVKDITEYTCEQIERVTHHHTRTKEKLYNTREIVAVLNQERQDMNNLRQDVANLKAETADLQSRTRDLEHHAGVGAIVTACSYINLPHRLLRLWRRI
jgi:hypothetical protein